MQSHPGLVHFFNVKRAAQIDSRTLVLVRGCEIQMCGWDGLPVERTICTSPEAAQAEFDRMQRPLEAFTPAKQ